MVPQPSRCLTSSCCCCLHPCLQELQRQFALYYRTVVNLNIFLADTLTLEQALMLNVACKWPFAMSGLVALFAVICS